MRPEAALAALLTLSLSACAIDWGRAPRPLLCHARRVQGYVGRPATEENRLAAEHYAVARSSRFLMPDEIYTTEFIDGRLDLFVDARGRIARIVCG